MSRQLKNHYIYILSSSRFLIINTRCELPLLIIYTNQRSRVSKLHTSHSLNFVLSADEKQTNQLI